MEGINQRLTKNWIHEASSPITAGARRKDRSIAAVLIVPDIFKDIKFPVTLIDFIADRIAGAGSGREAPAKGDGQTENGNEGSHACLNQ